MRAGHVQQTAALGAVVIAPGVYGVVPAPYGLRCEPSCLFQALCTLCADAQSTIAHIVGSDNVRTLMTELRAAEGQLAALVGVSVD